MQLDVRSRTNHIKFKVIRFQSISSQHLHPIDIVTTLQTFYCLDSMLKALIIELCDRCLTLIGYAILLNDVRQCKHILNE